MLKRHAAVEMLHHCRLFGIRALGLLLDQFKYPRRAGKGILQLRDHARNLIKGFRILVRIAEQTGQFSHRHCTAQKSQKTTVSTPADGKTGAKDRHPRIHHIIHKPCTGIGQGRKKDGPQRAVFKSAVDLVKPLQHFALLPVTLHHLLIPDHLIDKRCLFPSGLRL